MKNFLKTLDDFMPIPIIVLLLFFLIVGIMAIYAGMHGTPTPQTVYVIIITPTPESVK